MFADDGITAEEAGGTRSISTALIRRAGVRLSLRCGQRCGRRAYLVGLLQQAVAGAASLDTARAKCDYMLVEMRP